MNHTLARQLRIMGLLLALVGLAGCSAIKLGYSTLPELASWWIDGYLDLSAEQTPRVREELARLHTWHRTQELPRIVEMLGRLEQDAPRDITPAQACGYATEAQARVAAAVEHAEPAAGAIALTLTPRQLRHLERKFARKNAEWRSDHVDLPVAERLEKQHKQWVERMEMVYGTLQEPQRAALRQALAQSAYDPQRVFAERQRRQQDLLQVLRRLHERSTTPAEAARQLHAWQERIQAPPDPAYRRYQAELVEESCRLLATVHATTTAEQREQAVRRLRAYQRDLRDLSR